MVEDDFQSEVMRLRQELAVLKQEKNDLEILLETTTEHSDSVTDQLHEKALEALRQREEWFRTIAEATPVPVMISRISDGAILYANTAAKLAFATATSELESQSILNLYHNPAERDALVEQAIHKGDVQNYELQMQRMDGTCLWVTASLRTLVFDNEPTILSALCDITERKLKEDALRQQLEELQIEIDQTKVACQVAEIVQSDYFQALQAEIQQLQSLTQID